MMKERRTLEWAMLYTPGEVYLLRTIRPKYALPKGEGICIADLPTQILPRSNAGASLLAYLLVSKYVDHIPFYRLLEKATKHQLAGINSK